MNAAGLVTYRAYGLKTACGLRWSRVCVLRFCPEVWVLPGLKLLRLVPGFSES